MASDDGSIGCPDANDLGEWIDSGGPLGPDIGGPIAAHVMACSECWAIVVMALDREEEEEKEAKTVRYDRMGRRLYIPRSNGRYYLHRSRR